MIIPEEVKEAVSALSHRIRWRIVDLFLENESLSYTELLLRLKVRKGTLTHHLNRLMESGLIDNYSGEDFGDTFSSYYQLSSFGKDLVTGILSSVQFNVIPQRVEPREPEQLREPIHATAQQNTYLTLSKDSGWNISHSAKFYDVFEEEIEKIVSATKSEKSENHWVTSMPKLQLKRKARRMVNL
jgi:DNA-binding transcriptional ArsR family regulator